MTAPDPPDFAEFPSVGRVYFDPRSRDEIELIHREIFVEEDYRRHGIRFEPGQTIFDAGANVGLFSLYANERCDRRCSIYAFEPAPKTFEYLLKNAAENGRLTRDEVHLFSKGLTRLGGPDRARLTMYPSLPGNSTFAPLEKRAELEAFVDRSLKVLERQNPRAYPYLGPLLRRQLEASFHEIEEVDCELTTLSDVSREAGIERIDLLKIDAEGSELDILDGIDADLFLRISQIVIETSNMARAGALAERLDAAGFGSIAVDAPDWARALGLENHYLYVTR